MNKHALIIINNRGSNKGLINLPFIRDYYIDLLEYERIKDERQHSLLAFKQHPALGSLLSACINKLHQYLFAKNELADIVKRVLAISTLPSYCILLI